jgi:outer membrane protein insertion porin family
MTVTTRKACLEEHNCLTLAVKNRAQAQRKTCAFLVSAGLVWASVSPVLAQGPANPLNPAIPVAPAAPPNQAINANPAGNGVPEVAPPDLGAGAVPVLPNPPALPNPLGNPVIAPPDNGGNPPAPAGPALTGKIAQINIVHRGTANISNDAIRAVMKEKVGDQYDPSTAAQDQDAIKGMGYFNGDVTLDATPDPAGGVDMTFTVVENPIIKKIVFSANTPDHQPSVPSATLLAQMDTREGQVLNTNTLVRDLDHLFNRQTGYMRQKGYIVDVSPDINIDPLSGILSVPLIEAHVDHILIQGNKKTKTFVITREMYSKSGQVLDENKLQKDMTRVYNTGLFDQVGPYQLEPTDVGLVNVVVPVVEKRSGTVSVGVGYSSYAKLVGRASLAENNFRGLGERVSLQWEVDGISSQSSIEAGFFEPYIDKNHTSLDVDLYDKVVYRFDSSTFGGGVGTTNTYEEKHVGGTVSVIRPLSDTLSFSPSLRYESVTTDTVSVPIEDAFIRQDGNIGVVGFQLTQNTRDNNVSPAEGGLNSLSLEFGQANTSTVNNAPTPLAPGLHGVSKFGLDLRRYISLDGPRKPGDFKTPKKVLAVRLLMGFANSDLPFFEQYFLGGADDLRGVDTDRYWGNKLALFQGELRLPIGKNENLQLVPFMDAGDAWGSIYQGIGLKQHSSFSPTVDFGLGLRLVTPVGPIRLDEAFGDQGAHTQFSIGQSF